MRTKGVALATASNWISNYIVVQITPLGIDSMGWKFYIIWAVFNAAFVPVRTLSSPFRISLILTPGGVLLLPRNCEPTVGGY